jgi:hypothetical protein
LFYSTLSNQTFLLSDVNVLTLLDTGAFNTMIDLELAKKFGVILPIIVPITIGGNLGESQGCIIHNIKLGNFNMTRVFALAYPFKDWLVRHIIIGTNVLNNWDFLTSRMDNTIRFTERIPHDVPNKKYPYQNYFINGEYVAIQDKIYGKTLH